jgi:hypothetical protein
MCLLSCAEWCKCQSQSSSIASIHAEALLRAVPLFLETRAHDLKERYSPGSICHPAEQLAEQLITVSGQCTLRTAHNFVRLATILPLALTQSLSCLRSGCDSQVTA